MAELRDWTTDAASNNQSPPDGAPENWLSSQVNDWARETMAVLARYYEDNNGSLLSGGSANAYTLTPNGTYASLSNGLTFAFEVNATNTGASTLTVGSLATQAIETFQGEALLSGQLRQGAKVIVIYDSLATRWRLVTPSLTNILEINGFGFASVGGGAVDLANSNAALRVGTATGAHIEADTTTIQAKATDTTTGPLNVQTFGGDLNVGTVDTTLNVGPPAGLHLEVENDAITARNGVAASSLRIGESGSGTNIAGLATVTGILEKVLSTRNAADGTPALGAAQVNRIAIERSDGVELATLGFKNNTDLRLENLNHGGSVTIAGEDSGGVLRTLIAANAASNTEISHSGTVHLETQDETATGNLTGATVRQRSVGLIDIMPAILTELNETTNFTLGIEHACRVTRCTGSAANITITSNTNDPPIGSWGIILANRGGIIAVAPASGAGSNVNGSFNFNLTNLTMTLWWHGPDAGTYWFGRIPV